MTCRWAFLRRCTLHSEVLGNATAEAFAKGQIVAPTALSDGAPKSEHLARAVGGRLHSNHMTIDRIRTLAMAPLPQGARLPIVLIRVDGAWARTSVTLGAQILAPCLGARRVYLTLEKISKLLTCTSPKDQHIANYNMCLGRNLSADGTLTLGYHVTGRSLINQPMSKTLAVTRNLRCKSAAWRPIPSLASKRQSVWPSPCGVPPRMQRR